MEQTQAGSSLPEDFVQRAVQGLKGEVSAKIELLNWLAELSKHVPEADRKLIDLVQRALFESDPAEMPAQLEEPQLTIWNQILKEIKE